MQISRVTRSKSAARRAYDQLSRAYDWLAGSSETPFMHLGAQLLAVQKGETLLEIGPGTGKALVELAILAGETGCVHGIDLSPGMLRQAQRRLESTRMARRVHLTEGDGASLPYQTGSYDVAFICFTLELFDTPEIPIVLAEIMRVLKPGGRLGVVSLDKTDHPSWIVRLYEWLHTHWPSYVDCRPINGYELIQSAGLTIEVSLSKRMWGLPVRLVLASKA